jgi:hypothetical protein
MRAENPALFDIIRPPSEEVLDEQVAAFGHEGVLYGKFVRIGNLPLLAPAVTAERLPGMRSGDIEHTNMLKAAFRNPDLELRGRVWQASAAAWAAHARGDVGPVFLDDDGLIDAGKFSFSSSARTLAISDRSSKFGRANDEARQETARLIQQAVGDGITVAVGS